MGRQRAAPIPAWERDLSLDAAVCEDLPGTPGADLALRVLMNCRDGFVGQAQS